jgi:hypothetical protein
MKLQPHGYKSGTLPECSWAPRPSRVNVVVAVVSASLRGEPLTPNDIRGIGLEIMQNRQLSQTKKTYGAIRNLNTPYGIHNVSAMKGVRWIEWPQTHGSNRQQALQSPASGWSSLPTEGEARWAYLFPRSCTRLSASSGDCPHSAQARGQDPPHHREARPVALALASRPVVAGADAGGGGAATLLSRGNGGSRPIKRE